MMDKRREQNWRELCEAAAAEQDPNKLMALVAELNKVLDELHRDYESAAENKAEVLFQPSTRSNGAEDETYKNGLSHRLQQLFSGEGKAFNQTLGE
jgi:hypothetical protein